MKLATILLGTIPFLLAALLTGAAAGAEPSGQIAFLSGTEQEDLCVCVLDIATGAVTRVGMGGRDGAPVWSPDGAWIAFPSQQPDGMGIRLVRADGSEPRAIAHARLWNRWPRWAPDGKRLMYAADDGEPFQSKIVVYDVESNTETGWGGDQSGLMRPVWITGMKLLSTLKQLESVEYGQSTLDAFMADLEQTGGALAVGMVGEPGALSTEIFLVTVNGAAPLVPKALNRGAYVEWVTEINPKGDRIAVETNDGGDREIFVFSKRGMTDVTNHHTADWNPSWSPDGEWVVFESFRGGRRGIYRVYCETIRVFPVAVSENADNWCPAWSPDGNWIAFVSDRTGDPEIFLCDAAGTETRQLTNRAGLDYAPAWRPKGTP
ncbi:MAG: hypothetical protein QG656_204 [Candidatus Hydrogenedentes bacterium]|nr:hypothetical protein [Candidatus Hydrogenedentota bacterium]